MSITGGRRFDAVTQRTWWGGVRAPQDKADVMQGVWSRGVSKHGTPSPDARRRAAWQDPAASRQPTVMSDVVADAVEHFSRRASAFDRSPRVMIDGHCNVLWHTAHAERLLQPPLPLWIEGGKVHASGAGGS